MGLAIRIKFIALAILIYPLLAGCGTNKNNIDNTIPEDPDQDAVSFFTGKKGGVKLSDMLNKNSSGDGVLPVNALLWRAALDIASFVPLDDVDTFGGSIVTEWHQSEGSPDNRIKLAMFVVGRELRSDAIKVRVYLQKRQANNWVDAGRDETLSRKLEDLVLTRARELRASAVAEIEE